MYTHILSSYANDYNIYACMVCECTLLCTHTRTHAPTGVGVLLCTCIHSNTCAHIHTYVLIAHTWTHANTLYLAIIYLSGLSMQSL